MTVRIVDDLLDEEAWTEVWSHFQFADLAPVSRTAGVHPRERGKPRTDAGRTVPERKVRCTPRKVLSEHR